MPLTIQIFHTRRAHFGAHSGIQRFIEYLDPARVRAHTRAVSDGDDDFPLRFPFRNRRVRGLIRRLVQGRGQIWYHLSDLAAEAAVLRPTLAGAFDVLHFVDGEQTAQFLPAIARRLRLHGRTVATYHQPLTVLPRVVVPSVVRNLDHVTVVASAQLEWFARVIPRDRLSVVLHGIDVTFFTPDAASPISDTFRCITTGSYLRDWALLADIARALESRRDIQFHVVSGSAPAFEHLPNVTVHRGADDHTLRELYRRSNLLLLPLVDATANNALLEGMASALPVVASDLPALREYAPADGATFLARQADAFADAIVRLADDPVRRRAMGRSVRSRAEALAWPRIAEAYSTLYELLAAGQERGGG
jgi:glycosyltransferase involved in cell wall biosynthesis